MNQSPSLKSGSEPHVSAYDLRDSTPSRRIRSGASEMRLCTSHIIGTANCDGNAVQDRPVTISYTDRRLSTSGSFLRPAGNPDAQRLDARILERTNEPVSTQFDQQIGLMGFLAPATPGVNQGNGA
jgi:hypothetical protein